MVKIRVINNVPLRIIEKAQVLINVSTNQSINWRKVSGINQGKSYKLNNNYRMLLFNGTLYIGSHDSYIRVINSIKRRNIRCNCGR